jgi:hypothetical protein
MATFDPLAPTEQWVETKVVGGKKTCQPQTSHWWWMASEELQGYPGTVVYEGGHRRWGIENKAFNELTQFYHLEHCYPHEPLAMLAQMLILSLGFMVRLRVKTAQRKCFRDIVLYQLADATRRISGLRERGRLVRDAVSQTSILKRWTVTNIWPPGSKSRDVTHLTELLMSRI